MEKEIFQTIINNIEEILEDVGTISEEDSLKELGANSIERAEIIINTMQDLGIKISLIEFGTCKNIKEIIEVLANNSDKRDV